MYKLFYYPRNASWAPHLILKELGVEYELGLVDRKANEQKSKEYLALNPSGRIPTLVHGEKVIFESAAIALYLCEQHPSKNLVPPLNSPLRPLCYQWLFYLTATLQAEMMVCIYPEKHTTHTDQASNIRDSQEQRIIKIFGILDKQIGDNQFLLGDKISICDYFLFMMCHWGRGLKKPPLSFTSLCRCLKALAARPTFQKVSAIEDIDMTMY